MQAKSGTYFDPIKKRWSGPKRKDYYGADMTLGEAILYALSRVPEKIIQVMDSTGEQLTSKQLMRDGKLMALQLQRLGLKIGDVVGLNANNTTRLTAVMLGSFLCGAPTHALFPGFDKDTIKLIYGVSQPRIIFCDVETYELTKAATDELELPVIYCIVNGKIEGVLSVRELLFQTDSALNEMEFPCAQLDGDATAVILCSSGTTGTPKGVQSSHRTLLNRQLFPNLFADAVLFTFSTQYWASGLLILLASLLNGVKRIITDQPYTPKYFAQLVERHRITHLLSGPHHLALVLKTPSIDVKKSFGHVKAICCGGSKVPKVLTEHLNFILADTNGHDGVLVGYGMSEMMILSMNAAHARQEGSEGKLLANTEVRVVSKEGKFLRPNEEGVLHVRIPYKWAGYYRNAEATKKAYIDGNWLITGDIGFFDDEGFLHICTRDNDVFKSSNFQIYPELIEEVVMQLDGVLEACVFGLPDFVASNLTACAVVRAKTDEGEVLTTQQIEDQVKHKLAAVYQLQGGVYFMDELPKTGSGKIQRRKVLDLIEPTNRKHEL